ncbi:thioredoxin-disulfide reductase [Haloglycomyces albus]|uniref:thioredoxin-disulfide reductase n=1 Tax=Haloglycomyces albus TaxID=526067 RepID=UPI0004A2807A|nr:thioredoxin-disulfide reductase [Haloglycomyces albus]
MSETEEVRDVIIVGSGPAGYTAAVYTARADLKPLVFEGSQFGGALMDTTDVENYPGFVDGIMGPDLMDEMRKQAKRFGAELVPEDVSRMELEDTIKRVWVGDQEYRARTVILSTGSAFRKLGVPGEDEYMGHGVSACATCDGFFFRDQHIVVVGGGDTAMEEATFLTKFAEKVTIVHRRDTFRASRIMAERAMDNPKIDVRWNSVVTEILGEDKKVSGLQIKDTVTGEESVMDDVTGVFLAIGHDPRSDLFKGQVDLDDNGYVVTQPGSTRTNLPGVFAAGDLTDPFYQQAVTAAGTGCMAALDVDNYL